MHYEINAFISYSSRKLIDCSFEGCGVYDAGLAPEHLPFAEEDEGGDTCYLEVLGGGAVFIDVDLDDCYFVAHVLF